MKQYRTKLRSPLAIAAALSIAAISLGACSSSSSSSPSTTAANGTVNAGNISIGYENNGADPSLLSVSKGYFKDRLGSGVSLKLFDSGVAALSALASGQLPFMCGLGFPPVISAIAKGVPLAVIFNQERYTENAGLVVKTSSGINSVADLKGKKVALVIGSQASFELATYAKNAGLDLSTVTQINMTPPEIRSAWTQGSIDAAVIWSPVFDALSAANGKVVQTDANLPVTGTSYNICVANTDYAKAHPAVAAAFVKALDDGVQYYQSNPTQATQDMATAAGIDLATAKSNIAGYHFYTASDQATADVLGTSKATSGTSGTAQSLLNNWKALFAAGTQTSAVPSSVAANVDPTYAALLSK